LNGLEKIYYKRSIPNSKNISEKKVKLPHLIFVHDLGDYHGRYLEIGNKLIEKLGEKILISWIDMKGHGLSSGTRAHIYSFDDLLADLKHFISLEVMGFDLQNILVGQGMGALLGMRYFQQDVADFHKIHGLVLSNLPVKLNIDFPEWILKILKKFKNSFSHIRIPLKLDGFQLTHDIELAKSYNSDPLINQNIPVSTIREVLSNSLKIRTSCYFINIPTLVLVGEKGKLINVDSTRLFFKGMPKGLSSFFSYPNSGHDLFNDLDRDIIYNDLYNWINTYYLTE
jgi:lysophospholipase